MFSLLIKMVKYCFASLLFELHPSSLHSQIDPNSPAFPYSAAGAGGEGQNGDDIVWSALSRTGRETR